MFKVAGIIIGCLVTMQTLTAALPPLYQSKRELMALLDSSELSDKLSSGERIQSIFAVEGGYQVVTNKSLMFVEVLYESHESGFVGPARFSLVFYDSHPLVD